MATWLAGGDVTVLVPRLVESYPIMPIVSFSHSRRK